MFTLYNFKAVNGVKEEFQRRKLLIKQKVPKHNSYTLQLL